MPRTCEELLDHATQRWHESRRSVIFEFSGHISRDLRQLREEVNAVRTEAGLGPSPVQPSYPEEEVDDL